MNLPFWTVVSPILLIRGHKPGETTLLICPILFFYRLCLPILQNGLVCLPGKTNKKGMPVGSGRLEMGSGVNQVVRIRGRRRRREEGRRRDWIPKVKKKMVKEGVVVQRKRRRKRKNRVGGIWVVGSSRSWFACTHLHQQVVLPRGRLSNIMISLLGVIKTKD